MRTPPSLADFTHARACKPFCEKSLTLPGILVDLWYRLCSCGVTLKDIRGQILSECLCNLAPTGVVNTDKGHFWLLAHTLTL